MATTEIERKFLIDAAADIPVPLVHPREQRQGYLALDPDRTEVRVRLESGSGVPDTRTLTVKRGSGTVRAEVDVPLDQPTADALWDLTVERRLVKVRRLASLEDPPVDLAELGSDGLHARRHAGLIAEVDTYQGALTGLVVAEVEFGSTELADAFQPPAWFGREITADDAFRNQALAKASRIPG